MSMEITVATPSPEIALVRLKGKFTIESVSRFRETTTPLISHPVKTILIDFGNVRYIDSSGIGSLILLLNRSSNIGIDMVIFDLTKETEEVLNTAHLEKFFHTATSESLKEDFPGIEI
ncbi:MAG: STAS domain-containing protein [Spirochaetes bacterium]|nr:STAS domain-containing protein [Spirochaetota bacterium]